MPVWRCLEGRSQKRVLTCLRDFVSISQLVGELLRRADSPLPGPCPQEGPISRALYQETRVSPPSQGTECTGGLLPSVAPGSGSGLAPRRSLQLLRKCLVLASAGEDGLWAPWREERPGRRRQPRGDTDAPRVGGRARGNPPCDAGAQNRRSETAWRGRWREVQGKGRRGARRGSTPLNGRNQHSVLQHNDPPMKNTAIFLKRKHHPPIPKRTTISGSRKDLFVHEQN